METVNQTLKEMMPNTLLYIYILVCMARDCSTFGRKIHRRLLLIQGETSSVVWTKWEILVLK